MSIPQTNTRVLLLSAGLFPALMGTTTLLGSAMVGVTLVAALVSIEAVRRIIGRRMTPRTHLSISILIATTLSSLSSLLIHAFLFDLRSLAGVYVQIAGFTPVLYLSFFPGWRRSEDAVRLPLLVIVVTVLTGIVREVLGKGSLGGIALLRFAPVPFFKDAPGAFFCAAMIAGLLIVSRLLRPSESAHDNTPAPEATK